MSEVFQESTKSLFRPHQVEQTKEEIKRLENTLNAPTHIAAQIQDRGEMTRQLRSLRTNLEQQAPKPYEIHEKDSAVARSEQLKAEIIEGMPTQPEMRRNPAGAVDKHRKWEFRNKPKILEWKNIQLRRHAGGDLDELPDSKDVANFEKHRPSGALHELNMHNEQISGKLQFGPAPGVIPATIFSDKETDALKAIDPEIASQLVVMNNEQRASVKAFMQNVMTPTEQSVQYTEARNLVPRTPGVVRVTESVDVVTLAEVGGTVSSPKKARKKSPMTPERLEALARGRATAAANRAKKQEG